ncbi:MAG: hypothetical protein ACE5FG_11590 [Myxococcota bacterium]
MGLDLAIALGLIGLWLWRDAVETQTPRLPYLLVTLAIGAAGPLMYLLHRGVRVRSGQRQRPHA